MNHKEAVVLCGEKIKKGEAIENLIPFLKLNGFQILHSHVGEGGYEMQEKVIKTLLAEGETKTVASGGDDLYKGEKIVKTEKEWRKILTKEQFYVLREQGTERAFTGELTDNHVDSDYNCAACHLKLFNSKVKFESGTGWISFYQPIAAAANVTVAKDNSLGISRDEAVCSHCHSHLVTFLTTDRNRRPACVIV